MPCAFVTFTGIDQWTDLNRAAALASRYPVEFAVLYSESRAGNDPRYPSPAVVAQIRSVGLPRLALHLCGEVARHAMWHHTFAPLPFLVRGFGRVQVNGVGHGIGDRWRPAAPGLVRLGAVVGAQIVLQCDAFPLGPCGLQWLHDKSGGQGQRPATWPRPYGSHALVGYAGGLTPANIETAAAEIATAAEGYRFWLDMETGARDRFDHFDLDKCEAVCRALWPSASPASTPDDGTIPSNPHIGHE